MTQKSKFGKFFIVFFLTALIWVWADLAQDARLPLSNAVTVSVGQSDPTLWISFEMGPSDLRSSTIIDNVVLKGPASRVAEVERMKNKGALDLNLFVVAEREGLTETGTRTVDVLNLLRQSDEIRELGLTVEECEPRTLTVQVTRLVERSLLVECVDDDTGVELKVLAVEPSSVKAFVPPDDTHVARIRLTPSEQNQARLAPLQKSPYVELAPGQRRDLTPKVKVTLSPAEDILKDYSVQATLGFSFSPNLQGKYTVKLQNETELASVLIKATPVAKQAYEQQPFQIFLYILDSDKQATDFQDRPVVFNFPEDYVRNGEITRDQSPPMAQFKLEPVTAETP